MRAVLTREAIVPASSDEETTPPDAGAFEDFYTSHRSRLYRALTMALRDRELAVEATDEAMTRAYERWDDVRTYGNPGGWVYRVAMNWATSRLRKLRHESSGEPQDRGAEDTDVTDPKLLTAIQTLSLDHRSVIVMRFFLDWSTEDMAIALDVPPGTVKSRLSRALASLSATLGPHHPQRSTSP